MRITPKSEHAKMTDEERFLSLTEQEYFVAQGFALDQFGRPLHPWAATLSQKGVSPGKGNFYYWGPNKTVDPIVITAGAHPHILLIQRRDTGEWALPGGFIDENESPINAAQRELHEETSLMLGAALWQTCYHGPVDDPRSTLNAWPETTALITQVPALLEATANDDAVQAKWIALENIASMNLYGSHKVLIDHGLRLILS